MRKTIQKAIAKFTGLDKYIDLLKRQLAAKNAQVENLKNRLKFYETPKF